jgi:SnoaL-like domain
MAPDVPEYARFKDWLERYRRAWIERNAADAGELFTEDAIYREQPFQTPFVGREAIQRYWATVTATQSEIEMRYGPPIVGDDRVAVKWCVNLGNGGAPITLAGEFFLLFTNGGQCGELREYWTLAEGRVEPPDWWGRR